MIAQKNKTHLDDGSVYWNYQIRRRSYMNVISDIMEDKGDSASYSYYIWHFGFDWKHIDGWYLWKKYGV